MFSNASYTSLRDCANARVGERVRSAQQALKAPLACLSAGQHNLAADEDEDDNLGRHHAIDQPRKQLRLVLQWAPSVRRGSLRARGELAPPRRTLENCGCA